MRPTTRSSPGRSEAPTRSGSTISPTPQSRKSRTTSRSTPIASTSRSTAPTPPRAEQAMPTPANVPAADGTARRSARERLLEAASVLFYAEGIQSVGIDRVIERAGVAKASLYSTFGSKEQLVCAYLDVRHAKILGRLEAAVDACEDPVEQILAVFDAQAQLF